MIDDHELEIKQSEVVLFPKTKYANMVDAKFIKGDIPWLTGIITAVIDIIMNHGFGHWKREAGKLELKTRSQTYTIDFKRYDGEQITKVLDMIQEKRS